MVSGVQILGGKERFDMAESQERVGKVTKAENRGRMVLRYLVDFQNNCLETGSGYLEQAGIDETISYNHNHMAFERGRQSKTGPWWSLLNYEVSIVTMSIESPSQSSGGGVL
jgi:hypothetical protein